jgi:hypothetical protein
MSRMMPSDYDIDELRRQLEPSLRAPVKPKRIKAIRVNSAQHWQPAMWIEVGKPCSNLERDSSPQQVLAIFESTTFIVCTPGHGVGGGSPYFFSREDVRRVVEME